MILFTSLRFSSEIFSLAITRFSSVFLRTQKYFLFTYWRRLNGDSSVFARVVRCCIINWLSIWSTGLSLRRQEEHLRSRKLHIRLISTGAVYSLTVADSTSTHSPRAHTYKLLRVDLEPCCGVKGNKNFKDSARKAPKCGRVTLVDSLLQTESSSVTKDANLRAFLKIAGMKCFVEAPLTSSLLIFHPQTFAKIIDCSGWLTCERERLQKASHLFDNVKIQMSK